MKTRALWAAGTLAALCFTPPMLKMAWAEGAPSIIPGLPSLGGLESLLSYPVIALLVWLLKGEREDNKADNIRYQSGLEAKDKATIELQGRLLEESRAASHEARAAQERSDQRYLALVDKFLLNADKTVARLLDAPKAGP